jgi:hypothetical protein
MSARGLSLRIGLFAALVSVIVPATVHAGTGYVPAGSFGAEGSGTGQFKEPSGVAVNNVSKNVYVFDAGNLRVQWFNSTGAKVEGQFNGSGAPTGPFAQPATLSEHAKHGTLFNLAVDNAPSSPSVGDVYVVDPGHNVIDKFSATGKYLFQLKGFAAPVFGVAVDASGNMWVAEEGKEEPTANIGPVQEFDNSLENKHVTTLQMEKLRSPGIAVDSKQGLYVNKGNPDVAKFDKEGNFLEEITFCNCVTGLAIDSGTDELLVDEGTTETTGPAIARFGSFGKLPEERLEGISSSQGLGVNGTSATHRLYATQRGPDTVVMFDLVPLPAVTTGGSSEVKRTTAKLEGEVNPEGKEVTLCQFEYGTSAAYGDTAPCTPSPGSGSSAVPVAAKVAGLAAQTTYHFRLAAGYGSGVGHGADNTFTTAVAVEGVLTGEATELQGTTATLNGSFEPNGFDTHYLFEYGPTPSYGSATTRADAGSATGKTLVSSGTGGLVPHQGYHFRVTAENAFGTTGGVDGTFTTAVVAPQVAGQPSSSFVRAQSAVLSASVNPEHTSTRYHFEYGACPDLAGCAAVQVTPDEESSVYGLTGATQEIAGLAPSTTYSYRLVASNEFEEEGKKLGGGASGALGTLTTGPSPLVTATTGPPSAVTSTSAVVSGAVGPDGQPATYVFELGVYAGAGTQYGVVFSGPTGAVTVPVTETLPLTGLQPGTEYAYRIVIRSGYGEAVGAPATFTTEGLPSVLVSPTPLAMLAVPVIIFPQQLAAAPPSKPKCKRGYARERHRKCVRIKRKRAKKAHRSGRHRATR